MSDRPRNPEYWERRRDRRSSPEWKARRAAYHMEHKLRVAYGIGMKEYSEMLVSQGGACGLCGVVLVGTKPLAVDHDHVTGRIRGLLCRRCNTALAPAESDAGWLDRAKRWLA